MGKSKDSKEKSKEKDRHHKIEEPQSSLETGKDKYLSSWYHKEIEKGLSSPFSGKRKEEFITEIRPQKNGGTKLIKWIKFSFSLFLILVVLSSIAGLFIYIFQVQSINFEKSEMEKPSLATEDNIEARHLSYILNEIGAYKLHSAFYDGIDAKILVWISNTGQKFTAFVKDGSVKVEEGSADNLDISVSIDEKIFRKVYSSDFAIEETKSQIEKKRIYVEKQSKDLQLALRGFRSFQKTIFPPKTALFFFTSVQLRLIYVIVVLLIIMFSVWYFRNI